MQAPGTLNLTMYQGASWDYTLTWQVAGTPVNLTGYSARMQVRESTDATAVVFSLASGSGITLGGTAGTIFLEASATTTAAIASPANMQYVYDLELVSAGSAVTRLVEGCFFVDPEVTR
jgi:hypothetical protein